MPAVTAERGPVRRSGILSQLRCGGLAWHSGAMTEDETRSASAYASFLVRRADWTASGMALQCAADGEILGDIEDGDGLDTLMRFADEHRMGCERTDPGSNGESPEALADRPAEAHLKWVTGPRANQSLAVLHRLDYNVWDAWLHRVDQQGQAEKQEPPVRLTRNGVSYEMALAAVFRAMGDTMPTEFRVSYPRSRPRPGPSGQKPPAGLLSLSYARYLVRGRRGAEMILAESGQTGGKWGREGVNFSDIRDGDSLDMLIRAADEYRPRCVWAWCPGDERDHPERTVQKRAEVVLSGGRGVPGDKRFASLRRLDGGLWSAWLHPLRRDGQVLRTGPPVRLTPAGVGYEMALAAVYQAVNHEMDMFQVAYLYPDPRLSQPLQD